MTDTAIFDLDGTLLDTLDDLAFSCNSALLRLGFPQVTRDQVRSFVGNGLSRLMEQAVPSGRENPLFQESVKLMRQIYAENWMRCTKPYDGVMELLEKLKMRGIRCAIVSNKPDFQVKELASLFFRDYIDKSCAIGEREGVRRKPYPDSVLEVMNVLGSAVSSTLYAGDSDVDILTAENAGIRCISVAWGFRSEKFLMEHGARFMIRKPGEFLDLL